MKISRSIVMATSIGLALTLGTIALAKDASADLAKAPEAVQAAVKKALGEKKLQEFDKETLDGKLVYEAGWKEGDVDHAAIIDSSGKLIQTEADVELDKVPAAVKEAVKKAHPDAKLDEAAMATADGVEYYSLDVKVGAENHVMNITSEGKLIADLVEKAVEE